MIGYAATDVFPERELQLLHKATSLVELVTDGGGKIRCHELARAVGRLLELPYQDGSYGAVEHTWLWVSSLDTPLGNLDPNVPQYGWPNILDVYSVGQLPMVQLVANKFALPHSGKAYRLGEERSDIDQELVDRIVYEIGLRRSQ